jgi:hypothetical protein
MVRSTYSRAFPDEPTISGVQGDMHVGVNSLYEVSPGDDERVIVVNPENVVTDYTYEVRGITGAEFIRGARGGISGFSASWFMARDNHLSDTPSTVLFDGAVNTGAGTITGSFRTFGRLGTANNFTIEILYPSQTPGSGILQQTWEVTAQIEGGGTHIVIEDAGIVIPDEGGDDAGGWDIDLIAWEDEEVIEL